MKENPISGQHLRVVASEVQQYRLNDKTLYRFLTVNAFLAEQFPTAFTSRRNATGHVVHAVGVEKHLLDALSEMLNFRKVLTTREILKV